jgi:glycerol uptake facilitator-like aquaporin
MEGGLAWPEAVPYISAQVFGGISGTIAAHAMFSLPLVSLSRHIRSGPAQFLSEFIATFGLLCVIWGCSRSRAGMVPFAVASYITAAYWFTSSTSFANPAVTIARALSDTFAGIRPADTPLFIIAQVAGGIAATLLFRWLIPGLRSRAKDLVIPRSTEI